MSEIDEIELIRKHYGDFTGLYDPSQAVAHVKVLLAEIDAYERNIEDLNDKALKAIRDLGQERDEARAELARYAEELEGLREVVSQHEAVVDTDAFRLAAGITCRPGQDHSCADTHHIGRCYKPSAEPSGTEAGQ